MIVTFIGHRKLQFNSDFRQQLKELVLTLIINRNADTFLFGSQSDFDDLRLEYECTIMKFSLKNIKKLKRNSDITPLKQISSLSV